MLAAPPTLQAGDLTETDGLEGVQASLDGAKGGQLETLPVKVAAVTIRVPDYDAVDQLMAERFGVDADPGAGDRAERGRDGRASGRRSGGS